jgi:ABC-type branched-subunit amino acid transport system ATPase component
MAETDRKVFELYPELRPLAHRCGLYLSSREKKMTAMACLMAVGGSKTEG